MELHGTVLILIEFCIAPSGSRTQIAGLSMGIASQGAFIEIAMQNSVVPFSASGD